MNDAVIAHAQKMVAAKPDPRVQAIRCMACRRLRSNPRSDDPRTWNCACGGIDFVETVPHDDELQIAVKLYSRELEENNTYSLMSRELIREVGS
jgi:hypothetical protein